MAKYNDCGYVFEMAQVTKDEKGAEAIGDFIDIEDTFEGLVYKKCEGLEAYGDPRPYVENYADSDEAYVHVKESDPREQTKVILTLYFFSPNRHKTEAERIVEASQVYHKFFKFISGRKVVFRDTARRRKVMMYLYDSTDPEIDRLYGIPYKEVEFKFKNCFGRSFDYDEELPITDPTASNS